MSSPPEQDEAAEAAEVKEWIQAVADTLRAKFSSEHECFEALKDKRRPEILRALTQYLPELQLDRGDNSIEALFNAYCQGVLHHANMHNHVALHEHISDATFSQRIMQSDVFRLYMFGLFHFYKDRLTRGELTRGLARVLEGSPLLAKCDEGMVGKLILAWDASTYVTRDGTIFAADIGRLWLSGTDRLETSLAGIARESIATEMATNGSIKATLQRERVDAKRAASEARLAAAEYAAAKAARRESVERCLRARITGQLAHAVALSGAPPPARSGAVSLRQDTLKASVIPGERVGVTISLAPPVPVSPGAACVSLDEGLTGNLMLTAMHLALKQSRIQITHAELQLLAEMYPAPNSNALVRWVDLLKALQGLPPGMDAANMSDREIMLELRVQLYEWEAATRAVLEGVEGRGVEPGEIMRFLKFRPHGTSNYNVRYRISVNDEEGKVAMKPNVRMFMKVAEPGPKFEEAVVNLNLAPDPLPERDERPEHPIFDALILRKIADKLSRSQLELLRLLRALDGSEGMRHGAVSPSALRYALVGFLGSKRVTADLTEVLVTNFPAPPAKSMGAKVYDGGKRRFDYPAFMQKASAAMASLADEKHREGVPAVEINRIKTTDSPMYAIAEISAYIHREFIELKRKLCATAANVPPGHVRACLQEVLGDEDILEGDLEWIVKVFHAEETGKVAADQLLDVIAIVCDRRTRPLLMLNQMFAANLPLLGDGKRLTEEREAPPDVDAGQAKKWRSGLRASITRSSADSGLPSRGVTPPDGGGGMGALPNVFLMQ